MEKKSVMKKITALGVGTICGAINGFILTKFQELPPMIVTLATPHIDAYLIEHNHFYTK